MVKEIIKDKFYLSLKSIEADLDDLFIIQDLKDTLQFHKAECVGMAANMIGYNKNIIAFYEQNNINIMVNPSIIQKGIHRYITEEGCLCHEGTKSCERYEKIKVQYFDEKMKLKIKTFTGFTAQIIQHELDHLEGILI